MIISQHKWKTELNVDDFFFFRIDRWYLFRGIYLDILLQVITYIIECRMKWIIHSQTLMVQPSKFWNW